MEAIKTFVEDYLVWLSLPKMNVIDIIEIFIIAFLAYRIILWVKDTRAWMLVKGLLFIVLICLLAVVFDMSVILWLFKNAIGVGITALVIIFQPELRNALEQLGRKGIISTFTPFDDPKAKHTHFTEKSINEIVKAAGEMAKVKTGALMVMEQNVHLNERIRTGIVVDAVVSSQLLINIFEHNTPLHDGAVILREDRVVAATCYLPLSDNMELSKELGTRHRAGLGVSEESDAITIIVSEETGFISMAYEGKLRRGLSTEDLKERLMKIHFGENTGKKRWWKNISNHKPKLKAVKKEASHEKKDNG